MRPFTYCPMCKSTLVRDERGLLICPRGDFTDYNSPLVAVAALIEYRGGVVIGRREAAPFKGEFCLPCGYINQYEDPREAVEREVLEETGLIVRAEQLLWACMPPLPGRPVNQVILHYHCVVVGGELKSGDDLSEVKAISPREMPMLCFETHQMIVSRWFSQKWGIILAA